MRAVPPNEFSDRLSPILVKELRQGLRTRIFVGSFVVLQVALAFLMIFSLASATGGDATEVFGFFLWLAVALPICVVLPAASLSTINQERSAGTLELMLLTNLTARRLLLGKWFAMVVQALLLLSTVIPYVVLRYFMGGVNLTGQLTIAGLLLYVSVLLCGLGVGLSPLPKRMTQTLLVVGVLVLLVAIPYGGMLYEARGYMPFFFGGTTWLVAGSLLWMGLATLFLAWEFGAGLMAPAAENHSALVRLLALVNLAVAEGFTLYSPTTSDTMFFFAFVYACLVCVGALCEEPRYLGSVYRFFARRGRLGRGAGFFFYPGWPSGILFTAVVLGLTTPLMEVNSPGTSAWLAILAFFGLVYFPFAMLRFFWPGLRHPFVAFLLVQVAGLLVSTAATAILLVTTYRFDASPWFRFFPTYAAFYAKYQPGTIWDDWVAAAAMSILSLGILLWRAAPSLGKMSRCAAASAAGQESV